MQTDQLVRRWGALKNERSSWMDHWREISEYLLPRSGRFFITDRNKGEKRHNNIYDSTGTKALNTLAAGMMSGMTSPARPWFRLTTADPELAQYAPVKEWLSQTSQLMRDVFTKSNTYRALHIGYRELGAFGTWGSIVTSSFKSVIHHNPLTAGEYAIATDYEGNVNAIYREFQITVGQMVAEFGLDACSQTVRNLHSNGNLDAWVSVIHTIEPRQERDPRKKDGKNMPWKSVHFEPGCESGKYLRESGFKEFNALAPRWDLIGGDIYGNSPAMEALGDVKQLQHEQLRKAQGIDYKTKPPLQAPTAMKNSQTNLLPGGVTFVDAANPNGGIRPAWEVNLDLSHLLNDIQDVRQRINSTFYADLFLMLANNDLGRMTATEVAERHEEKLLMLGPVLERLHNEMLDPKIELTFAKMLEAGIVPPPPQEMHGKDLNIEFVSMLAQAQRAVSTNSIDRYVANIGAIAQFKPDVLDKFDADEWADAYGDMLGIDPKLIVPDEQVALIRKSRAQAQQQAAQAEMANSVADTAQKLGSVDTTGSNAAADIINQFSGYGTPSPAQV